MTQRWTQKEETAKIFTPHHEKRERKPTLSPVEANPTKPKLKKPKTRKAAGATSTPQKVDGVKITPAIKSKKIKMPQR